MRIARLATPGHLDVVEEAAPVPGPGEVLLHVAACGVCASELAGWAGTVATPDPWYPGHEVSGVVKRQDEAGRRREGDRVAAWVTARGFAEEVVVEADRCFDAGDVPLDLALGEPIGCAVNAVELAAPSLGADVVVIGAGFMGNLVHLLAALRGPRQVIIVDVRGDALERAAKMGASRVIDASVEEPRDAVLEATDGRGADVTFEVTGAQAGLDLAGDVTRMSGTVAVVGFHQGGRRSIDLERWNWMAFRVANAHFRNVPTILRGIEEGMRLLTSGQLSLDGLVTDRYGLEQIDDAFIATRDKPEHFVKAVVRP